MIYLVTKKKGRERKVALFFLPALFLATLSITAAVYFGLLPSLQIFGQEGRLVIASATDHGKKVAFHLEKHGSFIISYTHSVDRVPVVEHYRINEEGQLVLEMFENSTFGAGLGDQMGELAWVDGRQVVRNINLVLDRLPLRIGSIANPSVCIENYRASDQGTERRIRLLDRFENGELVYIYFR